MSIDEDILSKISDITYAPNEYDKERFLLYMDDDNSVYLTLTKFKKINYYNEVLEQLEGKKTILDKDGNVLKRNEPTIEEILKYQNEEFNSNWNYYWTRSRRRRGRMAHDGHAAKQTAR